MVRAVARRYGQVCAVAESLELVGERWTLLIVRDLIRGPARFQDLRTQLPGIPTRLLSERLKLMVEHGLVARTLYSDYPPRARYALTDKGRDLGLVVGALATWGSRHLRRRSGAVHTECGQPVDVVLHCSRCDERVAPDSVEIPAAGRPAMKPARGRPARSASR
jgi:DNA-binding HxlR family transcriptional regulator